MSGTTYSLPDNIKRLVFYNAFSGAFEDSRGDEIQLAAGVVSNQVTGGDLDLNGNNLIGDFTSTPATARDIIKSNVLNGATTLEIAPNGTGAAAAWSLNAVSDLANSPVFLGVILASEAYLQVAARGGGAQLPFNIKIGATNRLTIETNGTLNVAGTTNYENLVTSDDDIPNKKYVDDGIASDLNLKQNLEAIDHALDKVTQLTGYTFEFIDKPGERKAGVIAQEVEEVLPEAVTQRGDHLVVAYGQLAALLIQAVKELKDQVDELKARVK